MRKKATKPRMIDLRPLLAPLAPLVHAGDTAYREEWQTNKAYHLGSKEVEYVVTLTGHEPYFAK